MANQYWSKGAFADKAKNGRPTEIANAPSTQIIGLPPDIGRVLPGVLSGNTTQNEVAEGLMKERAAL